MKTDRRIYDIQQKNSRIKQPSAKTNHFLMFHNDDCEKSRLEVN